MFVPGEKWQESFNVSLLAHRHNNSLKESLCSTLKRLNKFKKRATFQILRFLAPPTGDREKQLFAAALSGASLDFCSDFPDIFQPIRRRR